MALAVVGAIVVFISVVSYVQSLKSQLGAMTTVLQLNQSVPQYQKIPPSALKPVQVPARYASSQQMKNAGDVGGQVAAADLPKGAYLEQGMLTQAPELKQGQREVAIPIDVETGVAGKIHNGSKVDVYASYTNSSGAANSQPCTYRVLTDVTALYVGELTPKRGQNGEDEGSSVPITFALTADQAGDLTHAAQAADLRLALVGPGNAASPPRHTWCDPNGKGSGQ